jgi:dATP pyrophosphohydrolase
VLLINRADAPAALAVGDRLQGPSEDEPFAETAIREVAEETGIDAAAGVLRDWDLENVYDIYPHYLHRYAPGVTRNTEHVFGLRVPAARPSRSARASTPPTNGCPGARRPMPASRLPTPKRS